MIDFEGKWLYNQDKEVILMLTEQRHQFIIDQLNKHQTVMVSELVQHLGASESTIRRDLTELDKQGVLKKVHGGAILKENNYNQVETNMNEREMMAIDEKQSIALAAANLIEDGDVIYLDAGTTTYQMIDNIQAKNVIVVTNGIGHVQKLIRRGIDTILIGGKVKAMTEAIIGASAARDLEQYCFTKGFFGTNGVDHSGYTTPDIEEAAVKRQAICQCRQAYILADKSKLEKVSFVKFAELDQATLITTNKELTKLKEIATVIEVTIND